MSNPWSPFQFERTNGCAPFALVCEHASAHLPGDFPDLKIAAGDRASHAVWDIGALKMAQAMSEALDAPLVSCAVSRALYDCNRPFEAADCIPEQSEDIAFPGNRGLSPGQRNSRRRLIHDLFHAAVTQLIEDQAERAGGAVTLITLHSFTPVYFGQPREVEIGFLHHGNACLSEAALKIERAHGRYHAALNQPYGQKDGVTYSLSRHADANHLHSTMIEVRNDLIRDDEDAAAMGRHLAGTIRQAADLVTAEQVA